MNAADLTHVWLAFPTAPQETLLFVLTTSAVLCPRWGSLAHLVPLNTAEEVSHHQMRLRLGTAQGHSLAGGRQKQRGWEWEGMVNSQGLAPIK